MRTRNLRAEMGTWFSLVVFLISSTASLENVTGCVLKDPGMHFISLGNRTVLKVGENANVSCKPGYQIVPNKSAKRSYEYDYPDSESTADPTEMPEIEDNENLVPVRDGNYTCRDNGMWEPEIRFSCKEIICDSFYGYNLENGHIFYSSRYAYTVGTVASFLCNPGYIRHGPETRTCQIDGTWSGECVTCQRIIRNPSFTCPAPCVPEGARKTGSYTYEIGSRIDFHCPQSKTQDRDDRSRFKCCIKNGEYASWKGTKINCKEIICDKGDHYGFENGKVTYSSSLPTVGTEALFMCNPGYNRRGPMTRICQKDGTWSKGCVTCQKHQHNSSTCPAPCVPDGAKRIGSISYELGSRIQFYCFQSNVDYKVESRYIRHCVNDGKSASWNGTNINCKAKCEPLTDTYNVVQTGVVPRILSDKTVVELSCSRSLASVLAECRNGQWYPKKPTCEGKTNIRLAGNEATRFRGRVEIQGANGTWGTVCDDSFDVNDAKVVCRMLGLTSGNVSAYKRAHFGAGTGPIWLDDLYCSGDETDLYQCDSLLGDGRMCVHGEDASVACDFGKTNIRLAGNGATRFRGRVEIQGANGTWGTVCDDSFDVNDAKVVCRMLGFTSGNVSAYQRAHFGAGTGPIWLDDLYCSGDETDLYQCDSLLGDGRMCVHGEDASVACDFGKTNIRLAGNGATRFRGRVEIQGANGTWGTVCDDSFDVHDAKVVCRMLGFTSGNVSAYKRAHFGAGTGPIWLDDLYCSGDETDLYQCDSLLGDGRMCVHGEDASVACDFGKTNIRLAGNGATPFRGRVEIQGANGTWGSVCDYGFGVNQAKVVCRMLGLTSGNVSAYKRAHFGAGTGPIWLDDLYCSGDETDLYQCDSLLGDGRMCVHGEDASVACDFGKTNIRLAGNGATRFRGRVEIQGANGTWGTVCDDSFDVNDAKVVCRMLGFTSGNVSAYKRAHFGAGTGPIWLDDLYCSGDETDLYQCDSLLGDGRMCVHGEDASVACDFGKTNIRLAGNGATPFRGRVEIQGANGTWGSVCDYGFGVNQAKVVCRMLGLTSGNVSAYQRAHFGAGTGPIWLDDLYCSGDETDLYQCDSFKSDGRMCDHDADASVACDFDKTNIRLAGNGATRFRGRVEIQGANGTWGTVSDNGFGVNQAKVVCRMLGLTSGNVSTYQRAHFGAGTGPIWLDGLHCTGDETDLYQCHSFKPDDRMRDHDEDASVACDFDKTNIRLAGNGATRFRGRVEIQGANGTWGTVSDYGFGVNQAKVVCRMLGLTSGNVSAYQRAHFGAGTGPIWLDGLYCSGDETDLYQCSSFNPDDRMRDHDEDASVACDFDKTNIRLAGNGATRFRGRVEIQGANGIWGTVCDHSFDVNDAKVVCRMLGLTSGNVSAYQGAHFGAGTGPIWLNHLECSGNETDLHQCSSSGWGPNYCDHDKDASVACDFGTNDRSFTKSDYVSSHSQGRNP